MAWLGVVLPLLLLLAGLPLAFFATGLKLRPILRGVTSVPAYFVWLGGMIHMPEMLTRKRYDHADDEEVDSEDEDDDHAYRLGVAPEPIAATRGRRSPLQPRQARGRAQGSAQGRRLRVSPRSIWPKANISCRRWDFWPNPFALHDATALTDEALEENARMLEAVLGDFGVQAAASPRCAQVRW